MARIAAKGRRARSDAVIAWKVLPPEIVATEAQYHADFRARYGQLPFANLVQARTPQT